MKTLARDVHYRISSDDANPQVAGMFWDLMRALGPVSCRSHVGTPARVDVVIYGAGDPQRLRRVWCLRCAEAQAYEVGRFAERTGRAVSIVPAGKHRAGVLG